MSRPGSTVSDPRSSMAFMVSSVAPMGFERNQTLRNVRTVRTITRGYDAPAG